MPSENPWLEPLAAIVTSLMSIWAGRHKKLRCESKESPSGHDYSSGLMKVNREAEKLILIKICRYCGNQLEIEAGHLSGLQFMGTREGAIQ